MAEQAKLVTVEQDHVITKENDPEFWLHYQKSILLALKDEKIINEIQYRYAETELKKQFHTFAKERTS